MNLHKLSSIARGLVRFANMAAVPLISNTNMATAVMSVKTLFLLGPTIFRRFFNKEHSEMCHVIRCMHISMRVAKMLSIFELHIICGKNTDTKGQMAIVINWYHLSSQQEYYATHQCFLSHRSLYIAMWKVTDKEQGVNGIEPWLLNIQVQYHP